MTPDLLHRAAASLRTAGAPDTLSLLARVAWTPGHHGKVYAAAAGCSAGRAYARLEGLWLAGWLARTPEKPHLYTLTPAGRLLLDAAAAVPGKP